MVPHAYNPSLYRQKQKLPDLALSFIRSSLPGMEVIQTLALKEWPPLEHRVRTGRDLQPH